MIVIAALDPAIQFRSFRLRLCFPWHGCCWMPGSSPGMTIFFVAQVRAARSLCMPRPSGDAF
jgi:hypothetical protein